MRFCDDRSRVNSWLPLDNTIDEIRADHGRQRGMMAPGETMLQKKKKISFIGPSKFAFEGSPRATGGPQSISFFSLGINFHLKKKKRTTFTNISRETSFSVGRMAMKQNEWENDENRSDRDRNSSHGTRETKNDENPCGSVEKVNRRRKTKRTTEKKPNSTVA